MTGLPAEKFRAPARAAGPAQQLLDLTCGKLHLTPEQVNELAKFLLVSGHFASNPPGLTLIFICLLGQDHLGSFKDAFAQQLFDVLLIAAGDHPDLLRHALSLMTLGYVSVLDKDRFDSLISKSRELNPDDEPPTRADAEMLLTWAKAGLTAPFQIRHVPAAGRRRSADDGHASGMQGSLQSQGRRALV